MSESSPSPSSSSTCPQCGAPLSGASAEGLCPRCLLALNLEEPTRLTGDDTLPAKPPRPAPSPEELAPHFPQLEILDCLGRGGMGVVYKARQKSLNRLVALKLLAPERAGDAAFTARFEREAQALATLSHPNIVTIHDYGQAGGFCFLLMEFVDGVNLRQAMKASRFTPEQALAMVPPICEALQYAHEHGIVHRDIKPENLLMDKAGRVKIADFGIAKIVAQPSAGGDMPSEARATLAGTPQYMAPEQGSDTAKVDHRVDIYSLGVVLYEMLTGELPKGRLDPPSAHMRGLHIDVRLDEVVLRALETVPELRYTSAAEFRTQVETVVRPATVPAPSDAPPSSVLLKTSRGFFTTPEFLATFAGGFWVQQGRGEIMLHGDRLVVATATHRMEIPFTVIREVRLVRYPFRVSPAGMQSVAVTHEEDGTLKQLLLTPAESWFSYVGTVNDRVAEWFLAIRDAITNAVGKAPHGAEGLPLMVNGVSAGGCLVLLPVLAVGVALGTFGLLRPDANVPVSAYLIGLGPFVFVVVVFLLTAFIMRARDRGWFVRSEEAASASSSGIALLVASALLLAVLLGAVFKLGMLEIILVATMLLFATQRFLRGSQAEAWPATPPPLSPVQQQLAAAFGIRSRPAFRCLQLAWLGFLGFLGAIPGWERMWGFTGFFGFLGVATFIELYHRGEDGSRHPAMRTWWRRVLVGILLAVVIVLPVRALVLQPFVLKGGSASPELPQGSWVLVWKLSRTFDAGDMIIYQQGDLAMAGRVVRPEKDGLLIVRRNHTANITVRRVDVIGKVVMQTRGRG